MNSVWFSTIAIRVPRRRWISLALVVFLQASAHAERVLWSTASGGNEHWYEVLTFPSQPGIEPQFTTWEAAYLDARARGGHLATIAAAAENQFVFKLSNRPEFWWTIETGKHFGPWLGGVQSRGAPHPAASWYLVTGGPFTYTYWHPGEPNDLFGILDENRLVFFAVDSTIGSRSAYWNDESDINRNVVVCVVEYIPEPASIVLLAGVIPFLPRRRALLHLAAVALCDAVGGEFLCAVRSIARLALPMGIFVASSMFVALTGSRADAYLTVFGGPDYVSSVGTGYVAQGQYVGSPVNDAGQSVVYVAKYETGTLYGTRAFRVDSVAGAIELGHLGTDGRGDTFVHVNAINAVGTAVGVADRFAAGISFGPRAVRWDGSGTSATELGNLGTRFDGYTSSWAYDVNDSSTAVGYAERYDLGNYYGHRPVRWDGSGTTASELENLGTDATGFAYNEALAINNNGTTVGNLDKYVAGEFLGRRAVRWDGPSTSVTELGNLGTESNGHTETIVFDINDAGTAVGSAQKNIAGAYAGGRAVRWDGAGTSATELGHLGTDSYGETGCAAVAVNASGTAVGHAYKFVAGQYLGERAVRWDGKGTSVTELGYLSADDLGFSINWANDINDRGIAVGVATLYESGNLAGEHAVAWGDASLAIDLNTLIDPASGWVLAQAYGISNSGWISGIGRFDPDGPGIEAAYHRLFLLQIPEPATLGLVCGVLLPLLLARCPSSGQCVTKV